jgi:hypothetical protein
LISTAVGSVCSASGPVSFPFDGLPLFLGVTVSVAIGPASSAAGCAPGSGSGSGSFALAGLPLFFPELAGGSVCSSATVGSVTGTDGFETLASGVASFGGLPLFLAEVVAGL